MGLIKQECYGIECDECGKIHTESHTDFSLFPYEEEAVESAEEEDWVEINGKWYCPDCLREMFRYNPEKGDYERI